MKPITTQTVIEACCCYILILAPAIGGSFVLNLNRRTAGYISASFLDKKKRKSNSWTLVATNIMASSSSFPDDAYSDDIDDYCQVVDEFGCEAIEKIKRGNGAAEADENDDEYCRWVRLEKGPDGCLKNIDKIDDVFQMIENAKEAQRKYGKCDLYIRQWEPAKTKNTDDGEEEEEAVNGESVNGADNRGDEFSVMQFNALAEGLSSGPNVQKPFVIDTPAAKADNEKQQVEGYGGFASIPFPEIALDFSLRRWRLMEVILQSAQGSLFDLIAMEEVDRYFGFFAPILRLFGYDGIFIPKTTSPCLRYGFYSDGICLFWRKKTFELVSEHRHKYKVGSQVYFIAILRHICSGRIVVTAVTHLKASEPNESIRCSQVEELLGAIADTTERLRKEHREKEVSVLLLGDFNTQGEAVQKVLDYKLPTTASEATDGDDEEKGPVQSAYQVNPPPPSLYTTWKIRGSETRRIIDYIFYSSLSCKATLQVPPENQLEASKLPGLRYPSDHMMIAAKFRIE